MFLAAGLRDEKVFWGILATGVINLIATLVALKLIEVFGRRPLIIWPLAAIIAIMVTLTVLIVVNVSAFILSVAQQRCQLGRQKMLRARKKPWPSWASSLSSSSLFYSLLASDLSLMSIPTKCLLLRDAQLDCHWPCLPYVRLALFQIMDEDLFMSPRIGFVAFWSPCSSCRFSPWSKATYFWSFVSSPPWPSRCCSSKYEEETFLFFRHRVMYICFTCFRCRKRKRRN